MKLSNEDRRRLYKAMYYLWSVIAFVCLAATVVIPFVASLAPGIFDGRTIWVLSLSILVAIGAVTVPRLASRASEAEMRERLVRSQSALSLVYTECLRAVSVIISKELSLTTAAKLRDTHVNRFIDKVLSATMVHVSGHHQWMHPQEVDARANYYRLTSDSWSRPKLQHVTETAGVSRHSFTVEDDEGRILIEKMLRGEESNCSDVNSEDARTLGIDPSRARDYKGFCSVPVQLHESNTVGLP